MSATTAHVRCPPKRVLRRALEVADARDYRVQLSPRGLVYLVTPTGTLLGQPEINALAREIELAQEETAA
jgi:hypothetical protein